MNKHNWPLCLHSTDCGSVDLTGAGHVTFGRSLCGWQLIYCVRKDGEFLDDLAKYCLLN